MSKIRVELDYHGIGELMRGSGMAEAVSQKAAEIAGRAGDGYAYRVHDTGQRQAANVYPDTSEAWNDNLENNTLLKAMR